MHAWTRGAQPEPPPPQMLGWRLQVTAGALTGNVDQQQGLARSRSRAIAEGSPRTRPGCPAPMWELPARHEGPGGGGRLPCRRLFPLGHMNRSTRGCLEHPWQTGVRVDGAFGSAEAATTASQVGFALHPACLPQRCVSREQSL